MGTRLTSAFLLGLAALLLVRCGSEPAAPRSTRKPTEIQKARVAAPAFNADSAYAYIAQQVAFGPRVPNTPEHVACGDWLSRELTRHGADVIEQPGLVRAYDGNILRIRNIIGQFRPENRERILLFAHWDTRPFADKDTLRMREPIDGANDGGSGVGVLLEIARLLGADPTLDVGVDIVFFDAEDYGTPEWGEKNQNSALTWCLGSQYWANQPHRIVHTSALRLKLRRKRYHTLPDGAVAKHAPQCRRKPIPRPLLRAQLRSQHAHASARPLEPAAPTRLELQQCS